MITESIKKILSTGNDKKIATRDAYGAKLVEAGKVNKDIVALDADLAVATRSSKFAKEFPERFFDFGVAEQNMISAAAGLATMGKIPFASTFGVFASKRACDQVSSSVAYPKLNVKVVGTNAGVSTGADGATHQAIEDVGIMRSIPGIMVFSPCDSTETGKVMDAMIEYEGPCYLRLFRGGVPVIFGDNYDFKIGRGVKLADGDKASIISTGFVTHIALDAARELEAGGIEVDLINIASIKPLDDRMIIDSAKKTGLVITVEDHNIIGGLGSAVCEVLSENNPTKVIRLGIQDKFGASGTTDELMAAYGLDKGSIIKAVKKNI